MEVSLSNGYATNTAATTDTKHASKSPKAVNFEEGEEHLEGRKKYLTAKYGGHQMALIRKRLGVETWLLEALSKLYTEPTSKELDLDELLDIEEDGLRRRFLQHFLVDCDASVSDIEKFIDELLDQAHKL